MKPTPSFSNGKVASPKNAIQPKWQRVLLLTILAYEMAGCLTGGVLLTVAPDGRLMDMPVEIMRGTFKDFLIPGIILFVLGLLNTYAFIAYLKKRENNWLIVWVALGGLAIWFWIEIAILQELHWLHGMWGGPVIIGCIVACKLIPSNITQPILLSCGILASLLYIVINIIVPTQWSSYSVITQTVSELSAIGAPTRMLWNVLGAPYTLLSILFAFGIWKAAKPNRLMRIAGALLIVYGLLGIFWPFAPMHLRETLAAGGGTLSDTLHLTLAAITELIYLVALCLMAASMGRIFRVYSIVTILLLLTFGVLTFKEAPAISVNQPTPFIGVWERINIGVFLLWIIVLAIVLLKKYFQHHTPQVTAA